MSKFVYVTINGRRIRIPRRHDSVPIPESALTSHDIKKRELAAQKRARKQQEIARIHSKSI